MTLAERTARPRRYAVGGIVCAVGHNVVMIAAASAGIHYVPATILSFALVGTMGYGFHVRHTFRAQPSPASYARFMAGLALGFPLSLLTMALLCDGLQAPVWIAAPIATVTLFGFNYLSARWAILAWGRPAADRTIR